jgi:hypothetical protein
VAEVWGEAQLLVSLKEYAHEHEVSASTVLRRLKRGELKGKRIGRTWYVIKATQPNSTPNFANDDLTAGWSVAADPNTAAVGHLPVSDLVSFSSKALNSYLMMSERLLAEKDRAYQEKLAELNRERQRLVELEAYVVLLERFLVGAEQTS